MSDEVPETPKEINVSCPTPVGRYDAITMAHGGGGRLMRALVDEIFLPAFSNPMLQPLHDGALLETKGKRLAMTTDGYVVQPLFFPGGDIGKLAVCGTVNDLAMCAARPLYLSAAFVLEEGLKIETLRRVVESMRRAADEAGVAIVTGDTKVVERGRGDGLTVTTAGVGEILTDATPNSAPSCGHFRVALEQGARPCGRVCDDGRFAFGKVGEDVLFGTSVSGIVADHEHVQGGGFGQLSGPYPIMDTYPNGPYLTGLFKGYQRIYGGWSPGARATEPKKLEDI